MINTAMQLKAKIRNLSGGNSKKAQTLLRTYVMERFLERISVSKYKNNFILKGGMLVSAIVGINYRATMDIDTTVKAIDLNVENTIKIIEEIAALNINDGVTFKITGIDDIMSEFDYPGIRFMIETSFDNIRQSIKIDISTGDIITPSAIEFSYKLLLEDRRIFILTYNIETLLAEKLETIVARGIANTRMRDFYDIYSIWNKEKQNIDKRNLANAYKMTSINRNTFILFSKVKEILESIKNDLQMEEYWNLYSRRSYFINDLSWKEVNETIDSIFEIISDYLRVL